jgi:putative addiction module component (TIGR02574 family)
MQLTAKTFGIDRLSLEDRIRLMEEIWDTIDVESLPVPQWHKDELDRRMEAYRADPKAGSSWEDVKVRLFSKTGDSDDHSTGS